MERKGITTFEDICSRMETIKSVEIEVMECCKKNVRLGISLISMLLTSWFSAVLNFCSVCLPLDKNFAL